MTASLRDASTASSASLRDAFSARASGARVLGQPVARVRHGDAVDERLFFAQVREDPVAEIAALAPARGETHVVVSSAGCTALSVLAAGAGRVVSVDLNATQNHLVELKAAAATLGAREAVRFLGAQPSRLRLEAYDGLRPLLGQSARVYWDARRDAVARGVLRAGVTERFIGLVVDAMRRLVVSRASIDRMLAAESVEEQRVLFARDWSGWRWRALFAVLCGRHAFRGTYPREFFAHVETPSFAAHFRRQAERALTELPVRDNYFLHEMLDGRYPVDEPDGAPPYLSDDGAAVVAGARERLSLADGAMTTHLATLHDASVDGFALSNIMEWMDAPAIDALFREIERTAAPGARLVYRNFVGWTEVPAWCRRVVPDAALSERITLADRSVVQRRVVACRMVDA